MDERKHDIREIEIKRLDDFPNHPFKVRDDEEMEELVQSIKQYGVIVPAIVREKEDEGGEERYEIISGHRRKRACEIAGIKTMRCDVRVLTREEAVVMMVEGNNQRENVLPSEKAYAYKMELEAVNHQGKRSDLTSAPPGTKQSREELAEKTGVSHSQIQRYVRLTYLVPELLQMVDEGRIKMRPAVEISYLDEDAQRYLVDAIDSEECTPSHAQAIRMRELFSNNELTEERIYGIMREEKPNQRDRMIIPMKDIEKYIPPGLSYKEKQEYVCDALGYYARYRQRQRNRGSR